MPISQHIWTHAEINTLFEKPFMELLSMAHHIHEQHFDPNEVQISGLLNFKTGLCPEDCGYCAQSHKYDTGVVLEQTMSVDQVVALAKKSQQLGSTRFCMAAAWRIPPKKAFERCLAMVTAVKALGMETCMTIGTLTLEQAQALKVAGLDYYNHNLDTSPEHYPNIITTRPYSERLQTIEYVRQAGLNICCGGILGMGESRTDRISLLLQLLAMPEYPRSVPLNVLEPIPGTPLEKCEALDNFEFIRTVAVTRIVMPEAVIRLSGGRPHMSDEMQALCFFVGANSIHYGEKLLTTPNCNPEADKALFKRLGLRSMVPAGVTSSNNFMTTSNSAEVVN
ncbi:MAG: biotin synthase BioB [Gammaproteobacteria bacterium]